MHDVAIAIPFLLLGAIIGLPLATYLRGRAPRVRRARPPRPQKSKLHVVTRSQMDEDLQDLIRRRP